MTKIILEVVTILYLVGAFVMNAEWGESISGGSAKMQAVVNSVMEQLQDADGIQITNEFKLKAIRLVLPILINLAVKNANKIGLFAKSS